MTKPDSAPITPQMAESTIEAEWATLPIVRRPLEDCVGQTLREDVRLESNPSPALRAGTRLGPVEIAIVASLGLIELAVARQPRFMVVSTGDELVEPGKPIAEHQVRRSNAYAIVSALRVRGFATIGDDHIDDDEQALSERLATHLSERDVLIMSGGVSKGKFDFVPKVLKTLGVRQVFYHVAQRPGAPMWFGVGPTGQMVFGLPGNPVATLVCLLRYVIPAAIQAMATRKPALELVTLGAPVKQGRAMTYFLPVSMQRDDTGFPIAIPRPPNGPGDFLALTKADGFMEFPPQPAGFPAGFVAPLYRW